MDFLISPELIEFRNTLTKLFSSKITSQFLRSRLLDEENSVHPAPHMDEEMLKLWDLFSEAGVLMASIPEDYDGLGFDLIAAQLITFESARVLAPLPIFETIALGSTPINLLATENCKKELLPKIASGKLRLTGAFGECFGANSKKSLLNAKASNKNSSSYLLSGTASLVPSVSLAQALIVPALLEDGNNALFLIELTSSKDNFELRSQSTFDLVRSYSKIDFCDSEAQLISSKQIDSTAWCQLNDSIAVLSAAEMIGTGETALEMSIEYAKTRKQFSKPIGSFQAVSHKLANMYTQLQCAKALAQFAAWSETFEPSQFTQSAAAIKGYAGEIVVKTIQEAIQIHGGMGFTFEYDLHLYLRRAQVLSACYGNSKEHYKKVADIELRAGKDL